MFSDDAKVVKKVRNENNGRELQEDLNSLHEWSEKVAIRHMDKEIFRNIYVTYVRPKLEYAAPFWNPHLKKHVAKHSAQQPQQQQPKQENSLAANKRTPSQKDSNWFAYGDNTAPSKQQRPSLSGPNELFFGEDDKSSGLSYKDREERLRQLRERQQHEKQQKLEELKEQAAAAQRFREQQENERRRRLDEIRVRDADRRSQVEERKRIIQQAEQDRREAVLRKNAEREQRMEAKRRNEKSSISELQSVY
ncbi:hypothetical protein SK128_006708 [Halocaridina rubra]|uniref:Uncharacterized protein n=1 Tax=Halocaridina rubra TaxID=373956 RepID=A0AAN8ZSZ5_HALRR